MNMVRFLLSSRCPKILPNPRFVFYSHFISHYIRFRICYMFFERGFDGVYTSCRPCRHRVTTPGSPLPLSPASYPLSASVSTFYSFRSIYAPPLVYVLISFLHSARPPRRLRRHPKQPEAKKTRTHLSGLYPHICSSLKTGGRESRLRTLMLVSARSVSSLEPSGRSSMRMRRRFVDYFGVIYLYYMLTWCLRV